MGVWEVISMLYFWSLCGRSWYAWSSIAMTSWHPASPSSWPCPRKSSPARWSTLCLPFRSVEPDWWYIQCKDCCIAQTACLPSCDVRGYLKPSVDIGCFFLQLMFTVSLGYLPLAEVVPVQWSYLPFPWPFTISMGLSYLAIVVPVQWWSYLSFPWPMVFSMGWSSGHIFYGAELPGHGGPSSVVILPAFPLTWHFPWSGVNWLRWSQFSGDRTCLSPDLTFSMGLSNLAKVVPIQWWSDLPFSWPLTFSMPLSYLAEVLPVPTCKGHQTTNVLNCFPVSWHSLWGWATSYCLRWFQFLCASQHIVAVFTLLTFTITGLLPAIWWYGHKTWGIRWRVLFVCITATRVCFSAAWCLQRSWQCWCSCLFLLWQLTFMGRDSVDVVTCFFSDSWCCPWVWVNSHLQRSWQCSCCYLFLPWQLTYYMGLSSYLQRLWRCWCFYLFLPWQ